MITHKLKLWESLELHLQQIRNTTKNVTGLPPNLKELKSKIKDLFLNKWQKRWTNPDPTGYQYRQTKLFWPDINLDTSKAILKLNRTELSQVIQVVTGHGFNLYHQHLAGIVKDDECRFCLSKPEEAHHIVNLCEGLNWLREDTNLITGEHVSFVLGNNAGGIPRLVRFLRDPTIACLFSPPVTE